MEMESEPSTQLVLPKKFNLCNIVEKLAHLLKKKGIPKAKLVQHLQMLLKRGKLAGKSLNRLLHERHLTLTCRSDETVHCYMSSREYEFSCSNSPIYPTSYQPIRHKPRTIKTVQKVFKRLDDVDILKVTSFASPLFASSPVVRELRVTDSPFSIRDYNIEEDTQINDAAQEFINKFYNDLSQQKLIAALQPPSPYYMWST